MNQITHIITDLDVGGAERALFTLLTNGLEGPFRNRVISLLGPGHYGPLLEEVGIPVTCLNMRPGRPTPAAIRKLLAASVDAPTSILQGWMIHGNLAATLVQRLQRRDAALIWNIRTTLEGSRETKRSTRALTRIGAWCSGLPDAIIYNAKRSLEQYEAHGYHTENGVHLPNGFDVDTWCPDLEKRRMTRHSLGISDDVPVIGFVGRGHPQKDVSNLFSAFDIVLKRHPRTLLVAVGRELANYAGNREQVVLLGERLDVSDIMPVFDFLCLSSRAEGFPNVIGEAMACGISCVSTDVGDAREVVGNTGWVVEPRNPRALAEALCESLDASSDELKFLGEAARNRILQNYSISAVVAGYQTLYCSLREAS